MGLIVKVISDGAIFAPCTSLSLNNSIFEGFCDFFPLLQPKINVFLLKKMKILVVRMFKVPWEPSWSRYIKIPQEFSYSIYLKIS